MLNKSINTIIKHNMIDYGDEIVVGFSGGPDSLALLHILMTIKEEYNLTIHAAHINHMIRGDEALRDEEFCRRFCLENNITFHLKREDVNSLAKKLKLSSEEAGRKVRYDFFNEIIKDNPKGKIALAHNLNDNGETIIMRFLRGSSLLGMGGISPKRNNIIRPIIECKRSEIESYCINNNLNPVIDSTNLQEIYTRNKIRLNLIPYIIKNFNSNILENLNTNSHIARDEEDFLSGISKDSLSSIKISNGYSREKFNSLHIALRRRVLRDIIKESLGDINGIESKHIELLINFIDSGESGKSINIKKGLICSLNYSEFNISTKEKKQANNVEIYLKDVLDSSFMVKDHNVHVTQVDYNEFLHGDKLATYIDGDNILDTLVLRFRTTGDYIHIKGLVGKKKLKDLFIDSKVPREKRDNLLLVASGSKVISILNFKRSTLYIPTTTTKIILKINIKGE
ncbi:MAG: tRNA lysidine(34) synthetase TilS [Clostridium sp.]